MAFDTIFSVQTLQHSIRNRLFVTLCPRLIANRRRNIGSAMMRCTKQQQRRQRRQQQLHRQRQDQQQRSHQSDHFDDTDQREEDDRSKIITMTMKNTTTTIQKSHQVAVTNRVDREIDDQNMTKKMITMRRDA